MRRCRLLLDANVIVDAQARDFFLTAAQRQLVDVRWSDTILDEVGRTLTGRLELGEAAVQRLLDALASAFPDATAKGFEHLIETVELPDAGDRHVAAAALHEECDLLVTENVDDFPEHFADAADILVATVDEALSYVVGLDPASMASVVDTILSRLTRPRLSRDEYLRRLSTRAPLGAVLLGNALGIEEYERILADINDSSARGSPQEAVRELLAHLETGNADAVVAMVEADLAARLTGGSNPSASALLTAIDETLADVRESWLMAAMWRSIRSRPSRLAGG